MTYTFEIHKDLFSNLKVGKLFCKVLESKYFKLVGHRVSVTAIQLYCCSTTAAIDHM